MLPSLHWSRGAITLSLSLSLSRRRQVQEQVRALVDLPLAAKTLPLFKRMIRAPHREKLQRVRCTGPCDGGYSTA